MNTTIEPDFLAFWNNFSTIVSTFDSESIEMLLNGDWYNISQHMNISENLTEFMIKSQTASKVDNSRDSIQLVATVTVFYALIFIAGILGNLITCTVISRNKSMHTATNYYLFNLAISDLILLLSGMPPDLFNIWYPMSYPFTDAICIIQGVLSETSANATVLTITAFTVERYIAICHPFRQHTMSKLSRAVKFILAIWVTAFILAIPQAMQFGVVSVGNAGRLCTMKNDYIGHVFELSGFVFFVGPMTAICVLYVLIGVKLKKSKLLQGIKRKTCEPNRGMSGQTRVIRMLIAVAVAFFLCWAPFHAQRLMAVYGSAVETSETFYKIYSALTYISGILYFLSTCINPLLYNIMSYKFRDAFKVTLARQFGLGSKYQVKNHTYSALSRNNGSMRLATTVNTRPINTFSIDITDKRDKVLSSQESARERARRLRCVSVSSQSTLLTSLSKNDVFGANPLNRGEFQIASTVDDQFAEDRDMAVMPNQRIHSFRRQRNSLPASSAELQLHALPSIISCNSSTSSKDSGLVLQHNKHHNHQSCFSSSSFVSHQQNKHGPSMTNHNNNNGGLNNIHQSTAKVIHSPSSPVISKQTTLESISEKLRRGTRKVLLRRTNSNNSSPSATAVNANVATTKQTNFGSSSGPGSCPDSGTGSSLSDNQTASGGLPLATKDDNHRWQKSNSCCLDENISEKNFVHCFL